MRIGKVIGWSAIGLLALIAVLVIILLLVDVSAYRGPLQSAVSTLLGRSVRFDGALSLRPSLWPKIVVEDVSLANPEWASRPDFARAERLEFQVALLPLIAGDLEILNLALDGSDILLETGPDGRNNWTFKRKRDDPIELPDIESLTWRRSVVGFRSGADRAYGLTISEAEGVLTEGQRIQIEAAGTYQDVPFTVSLLGGTPSEFAASNTPWPIKLAAQAAGAAVEVEGTITRPLEGKGFDLQVAVKGNQLEDLSSLFDTALPALGSYALSGRVSEADDRYRITDLAGHLSGANTVRHLSLTKGTVSAAADAPMELRLEGAYADVPFMAALVGGSLAELMAATKPWPVKLEARAASASVDIDGTMAKPFAWDEFDINIVAKGGEISDLNPLIDAELPALGAYALSARLTAVARNYTITKLAGHVGGVGTANRLAITKGELSAPDGKPLNLKAQGSYGDVRFGGSLAGGTLAELTAPTKPWPIQIKAGAAGAAFDINGTVARPIEAKGFDLRTKVSGKQFSALKPLLGIAVPALGPYQLSGRVADRDDGYTVTGLKADIAGNDISGMLVLDSKAPRPYVSAKLASKRLDLEKLMPAGTPSRTEGREAVALDSPIPVDMLQAVDADVEVDIKRLVGAPTAIRDLAGTVKLKDGQVRVAPIAMSLPGGRVQGRVELDASADNPRLSINLSADRLDIKRTTEALANIKDLHAATNDLQIHLASRGKTVRALLEGSKLQLTTQAADVRYRTEIAGRVVPIRLSEVEITTDPGQPIDIALDGTIRRLPFSLRFSGGTLTHLAAGRETWPVSLSGHVAGLTFETKGEVIRPFGERDFDLSFALTGEDLDALDPLLEIDLPTRGPYRLTGRITETDNIYRLAELELSLEDDHATGSLSIKTDGPRPHIAAHLSADKIHLEDLTKELKKRKDQAPAKQDDERVIPDVTIPVKALRSVDLELNLNVTDVLAGPTGLGNVVLKAKLENGRLLISPFKGTLSGGQLSVKLDVDATKDIPVMRFQLTGEHVDYGALLKTLAVTDAIKSVLDADIDVTGRGNTLRSVFANANGSAVLVSGPGSIDHDKLDLWGANLLIGIMMVPMVALKTKKVMKLNCMVWPLDVTNGVARSEAILIDMPKVTVGGNGTINLGTEELDLLLKPARKRASLFSLSPPVRVTGTLSKLNDKVEGKAETFGKALLPFFNPAFLLVTAKAGTGEMNPCVAAIAGEDASSDAPKKKRGPPDAESTKTN